MGVNLKRQKDLYDVHIHGQPYPKGDPVWLHCPAVLRGHSRKLHRPWKGPYRIIKCISETTYRIQDIKCPRRKLCVHFNRLKQFTGSLEASHTHSRNPQTQTYPDHRPQPLESQLLLVDSDEDDMQGTLRNSTSNTSSNSSRGPPTQSRYTVRQRKPPDYYHNLTRGAFF